ncbi:membrane-bound lytic murein transglycosylase E [Klebsiella michiganensis]|nr:membrane-bound lytic murein transglycosylase E [Klebsiella michiganensis]
MPPGAFIVISVRQTSANKDRCVKLRWCVFLCVLLAGCSSKHDYRNPPWNPEVPVKRAMQWMPISEKAGAAWGVDPQLITAIIAIESGGNPTVVSKSGAVGLMQLKPSTSGRDVYRRMGLERGSFGERAEESRAQYFDGGRPTSASSKTVRWRGLKTRR